LCPQIEFLEPQIVILQLVAVPLFKEITFFYTNDKSMKHGPAKENTFSTVFCVSVNRLLGQKITAILTQPGFGTNRWVWRTHSKIMPTFQHGMHSSFLPIAFWLAPRNPNSPSETGLCIGNVAECGGEFGAYGCNGSSRALVPSGTLVPWLVSVGASQMMSQRWWNIPADRQQ